MPDEQLINHIRTNHQLATAELNLHTHHQSDHWQVFNSEFTRHFDDFSLWHDFRNNTLSRGMDDANPHPGMTIPQNLGSTLEKIVKELRPTLSPSLFSLLDEPPVGHPATFAIEGMRVSYTSCTNTIFAQQIVQSLGGKDLDRPLLFLEIGGGFGALARMLKLVFKNARIISVDLPGGNALATYFLKKSFPQQKIFTLTDLRAEKILDWQKYDFAVLPGWCLESITPGIIDYTINIRSMMEMRLATINWYFAHIQRLSKVDGLFYCVNRYHKKIGDEDITLADYPFDPCWDFLFSAPTPMQSHIHQLLARRRANSSPQFPHPALTALPKSYSFGKQP